MHGRLGDAVHVDQQRPVRAAITVSVEPSRKTTRFERLAAEDDVAQRQLTRIGAARTVEFGKLVERRRCLIEHRHALGHQQLTECFG
ncbi:hypothetical protein BJF84_27110 [Rhodococcus sp. CUA-806]|nr:hypothetical protein BJF84_27110 [Rhodococcus sp. CUA-806]